MKYFQEVTEWSGNIQNHIYYLTDDRRKMVGYIKQGTSELHKFKKPMNFDSKGRKFIKLSIKGEPDSVYFPFESLTKEYNKPEVIEVQGSTGKKYFLSKINSSWRCTCPGFQFRNKCKHVEGINK